MEILLYFKNYLITMLPMIVIGFLLSGIIHELLPDKIITKFMNKNILSLFIITIIGIIIPVCCWGCLPIAVTLNKRGVKLGPIIAFLIATPASSITALLVTYKFFGPYFTVFLLISVIFIGITMGLLGNMIKTTRKTAKDEPVCPHCAAKNSENNDEIIRENIKTTIPQKILSILKYAFIQLPKSIGVHLLIGILLASIISTINLDIFQNILSHRLYGYVFSEIFGILMYICATGSIPFVYALTAFQGLSIGAGLILLITGPVTSYAAILIVKKEFGLKILSFYLLGIIILSLALGFVYDILKSGV